MRFGSTIFTLAVVAALAGGCQSRQPPAVRSTVAKTSEVTESERLPPLALPTPDAGLAVTAEPPSFKALQLYAQGRDALLSNNKIQAIDFLSRVVAIDASSAIVFRDLGYAWLSINPANALKAYQRALDLDPADVDSRLQAARLLLAGGDSSAALTQMRLARLSDRYGRDVGETAVVDVFLGRLLAINGYPKSAIACLEKVQAAIDEHPLDLLSRSEMTELTDRPSTLRLIIAELYLRTKERNRAIGLYRSIAEEEPDLAFNLHQMAAEAMAADGRMAAAIDEVLPYVDRFEADRRSSKAFSDLFNGRGGDAEALRQLNKRAKSFNDKSTSGRETLRLILLSRLGRAEEAWTLTAQRQFTASLPYIRTLVRIGRASGHEDEVPLRLLRLMTDQPDNVLNISRGWAMLTDQRQSTPMTVKQLMMLDVPQELEAARFMAAALTAWAAGHTALAEQYVKSAGELDFKMLRLWLTATPAPQQPVVEMNNPQDLADFVRQESDDPETFASGLLSAARGGYRSFVLRALRDEITERPDNLAAVVQLTAMLRGDNANDEARQFVEASLQSVTTANEFYQLAVLQSDLDDPKAAEETLRRALAADPFHAASCNDLGYMLAEDGRELDYAEKLLYRAVGAEPENAFFVDSLGWLLYKRSKFAEATRYLQQAVVLSESRSEVILDHAADAAYRAGSNEEAANYWQQALELTKKSGGSVPGLRLRIEQKLRQFKAELPVDVAAVAE